MEQIQIKKAELLTTLVKNRKQHRKIFEEAVAGYKARAQELLEQNLQRILSGKLEQISVHLPLPQDQTKEYDRAIKMLEMSVDKTISLNEEDFASYVMDDWAWKRNFLVSNSAYSATATAYLNQ